jgi:hypothetical protein
LLKLFFKPFYRLGKGLKVFLRYRILPQGNKGGYFRRDGFYWFHDDCSSLVIYPRTRRRLLVYDGKCCFSFLAVPGINGYAIFGTVVMIPGFVGRSGVIKYPADFEFTLCCDKGGILENF